MSNVVSINGIRSRRLGELLHGDQKPTLYRHEACTCYHRRPSNPPTEQPSSIACQSPLAIKTKQRRIAMLHKANKMRGYHLVAIDGEIGHVDDFLVDEQSWGVQYLVVDTSNWIGGKSVLVSPATLEAVDSVNREIRVKLT